MALVSLRVAGGVNQGMPESDDEYGYGTRLCLSPEQLKALGINEPLRAGTVVGLSGLATVVESSERMDVDGDESRLSMDLQLTDLELKTGKSRVDASLLYGKGSS